MNNEPLCPLAGVSIRTNCMSKVSKPVIAKGFKGPASRTD